MKVFPQQLSKVSQQGGSEEGRACWAQDTAHRDTTHGVVAGSRLASRVGEPRFSNGRAAS